MSECSILELDNPSSDASQRIGEEIERAKAEDRAEAIVLGCAGMADLAAALSREHGLPVVDGVGAAVKLAEGLVSLGHKTSKHGGYAAPRAKPYAGMFAVFTPQAQHEPDNESQPQRAADNAPNAASPAGRRTL